MKVGCLKRDKPLFYTWIKKNSYFRRINTIPKSLILNYDLIFFKCIGGCHSSLGKCAAADAAASGSSITC